MLVLALHFGVFALFLISAYRFIICTIWPEDTDNRLLKSCADSVSNRGFEQLETFCMFLYSKLIGDRCFDVLYCTVGEIEFFKKLMLFRVFASCGNSWVLHLGYSISIIFYRIYILFM